MVSWNPMNECWEDDNDPVFSIGMTPEGGEPDETFETQEEFWVWYNDGNS